MNSNNINNSGHGNVFNQNISSDSINHLDINGLALEWEHRRRLVNRSRKSRIRTGAIALILAVIIILITIGLTLLGVFESPESVGDFLRDLLSDFLAQAIGGFIALIAGALGVSALTFTPGIETRNQAEMVAIAERAEDLGAQRKEWQEAKSRARRTYQK